jgi:hypothetical protein
MRNPDEQKIADQMFDRFRDELLKRYLSNTENYDKSILTLASAGLGLSLSAIRFVVPDLESAEHTWLLVAGWTLMFGSIVTSLSAYLVGNKAISIQLKNAEDYYIKGDEDAFKRKSAYIAANKLLNLSTGLMFVLSMASIISFVSHNVTRGDSSMSKPES